MAKEIVFIVFLAFFYQINFSCEQTYNSTTNLNGTNTTSFNDSITSPHAEKNETIMEGSTLESTHTEVNKTTSTATDQNNTSTSITKNIEEKQTKETKILESTNVTTEYAKTSTTSTSSINFVKSNTDHDNKLNAFNSITKSVIIIICICYFGLFALCIIRSCIHRIKSKPPYTMIYSRLKDDHDDGIVLIENME